MQGFINGLFFKVRKSLFNQFGFNNLGIEEEQRQYKGCCKWLTVKTRSGVTSADVDTTSDAEGLLENCNEGLYNANNLPYDAMLTVLEDFPGVDIHVAISAGYVVHDAIYVGAAQNHSLVGFDGLARDKTMHFSPNVQPKVTRLPQEIT